MQFSQNIRNRRMEKEIESIIKDPIPGVIVKRDGPLDFHFLIYNLDDDYQNGFYHAKL